MDDDWAGGQNKAKLISFYFSLHLKPSLTMTKTSDCWGWGWWKKLSVERLIWPTPKRLFAAKRSRLKKGARSVIVRNRNKQSELIIRHVSVQFNSFTILSLFQQIDKIDKISSQVGAQASQLEPNGAILALIKNNNLSLCLLSSHLIHSPPPTSSPH